MCDTQERGEQGNKAWTSLAVYVGYLRSHGSAGLSYYVPTAARNLSFDNSRFSSAGKVLGRGQSHPENTGTPRWYKFTF